MSDVTTRDLDRYFGENFRIERSGPAQGSTRAYPCGCRAEYVQNDEPQWRWLYNEACTIDSHRL